MAPLSRTLERRPHMGRHRVIAGASVAFGVLPGWVLSHIAAPAAGPLLHTASYSHGVLASGVRIPTPLVTLSYFKPAELATVAVTVALGLLLARTYLRIPEPAPTD